MKLYSLVTPFGLLFAWSSAHGSECAVTVPNMENPFGDTEVWSHGWYGSSDLAALIPKNGHWVGMGRSKNYGDKFWWWRQGYNARKETKPKLTISATKLDGQAPPVLVTDTTHGYGDNWDAMLTGMEFPTHGCWEVIGKYQGHELKITLSVGYPGPI